MGLLARSDLWPRDVVQVVLGREQAGRQPAVELELLPRARHCCAWRPARRRDGVERVRELRRVRRVLVGLKAAEKVARKSGTRPWFSRVTSALSAGRRRFVRGGWPIVLTAAAARPSRDVQASEQCQPLTHKGNRNARREAQQTVRRREADRVRRAASKTAAPGVGAAATICTPALETRSPSTTANHTFQRTQADNESRFRLSRPTSKGRAGNQWRPRQGSGRVLVLHFFSLLVPSNAHAH